MSKYPPKSTIARPGASQGPLKGPTEAQFTRQVIQLAKACGWLTAHFRPALTAKGWRTAVQGDGAGFPDLVLVHPTHGLLFVELKVGKNQLSEAQEKWLAAFAKAEIGVRVWYPEDWEEIEVVLMKGLKHDD